MVKGFVCFSGVLFLFLFSMSASGDELVVSGVYQGKNVFFQNPSSSDGKSFCVDSVYLNDQFIIHSPKNSAFEVDLSGLAIDEPVNIRVVYKAGCEPKLINPQVIRLKSRFDFTDLGIGEDHISFKTSGDSETTRYFIEKRFNDKWIIIASAEATGNKEEQTGEDLSNNHPVQEYNYYLKIDHDPGINRYRVKAIMSNGKSYYSGIMNYRSGEEPISFYPERVSDKITFSRETDYKVLDTEGNLLVKGKEKEIMVEDLSPGLYYLIIGNRIEKFIKK